SPGPSPSVASRLGAGTTAWRRCGSPWRRTRRRSPGATRGPIERERSRGVKYPLLKEGACNSTRPASQAGGIAGRQVAPLDTGAIEDVRGGIEVRVLGEPAVQAGEFGLRLPVALLAMPARGACPRGVAGVYEEDRHSRQLCLVGDEALQLGECPTRVLRPVLGP